MKVASYIRWFLLMLISLFGWLTSKIVFPIPTNDYLYVTGNDINTIVIYDYYGRQVKKFITPTTNNMIDLSNLVNGVYFVKVNDITKKIIKI